MNRVVIALLVLISGFARVAQATMDHHYVLQKSSTFEEGCFAPCECPVLMHDDLRGRFSLIPQGVENGYDVFAIQDAKWFVTQWDGSTLLIQGSGTYRSSAVAKLQRMEMDLLVGDRPVGHYDSGLVPIKVVPPYLSVTISMNHMYCHDTVFTVDAVPAPNDVRPPKLQFEQEDEPRGVSTSWGRLKKLWAL